MLLMYLWEGCFHDVDGLTAEVSQILSRGPTLQSTDGMLRSALFINDNLMYS